MTEGDAPGFDAARLEFPEAPPGTRWPELEDARSRELLLANGFGLEPDALLRTLESGPEVIRMAAARTLGAVGHRDAIPPLLELARTPDDLLRVEAAFALVRLGEDEGRAVLRECLELPLGAYLAPSVAAGDLARAGEPVGLPVVQAALEAELVTVRAVACQQLSFFVPFHGRDDGAGEPLDVFELFERALDDSDSHVNWLARAQLRELDHPRARELLERG